MPEGCRPLVAGWLGQGPRGPVSLFVRGNLPRDQDAGGPAAGRNEPGLEDFRVLKEKLARGAFVKAKRLGGAMIWELGGDTPGGELIKALARALQ